jgi:hypothetical protein
VTSPKRRSAKIRSLRPGESIPESEPGRYRSSHGYVRLRWLVGTQTYVETYEHRVVNGMVTTAEHVHHDNRVKVDNSTGNLVPLTAEEHNALHAAERVGQRRWAPYRSERDYRRAERKVARLAAKEEMRRMYVEEGVSTVEIARRLGIDPSNVSRALWSIGFRPSESRR